MKSRTYTVKGFKLVRTTVETLPPLPPKVEEFDLKFLIDHRNSLIRERDAMVAKRNEELAEVQEMIDNAKSLGLK